MHRRRRLYNAPRRISAAHVTTHARTRTLNDDDDDAVVQCRRCIVGPQPPPPRLWLGRPPLSAVASSVNVRGSVPRGRPIDARLPSNAVGGKRARDVLRGFRARRFRVQVCTERRIARVPAVVLYSARAVYTVTDKYTCVFYSVFLVVESRSRFRSFFLLGFRRFSYFPIAFRVRDGCETVFTFRFFCLPFHRSFTNVYTRRLRFEGARRPYQKCFWHGYIVLLFRNHVNALSGTTLRCPFSVSFSVSLCLGQPVCAFDTAPLDV